MMSLFIIFFSALYYFMPREPEAESIDSIKTKLSAMRKEAPAPRAPVIKKKPIVNEVAKVTASAEEERVEQDYSSPYQEDDRPELADTQDAIPWDEIEKGWESEVKEALIRLDPIDGEAMFSSYLNERENHKNEVDSLFSSGSDNKDQDRAPSMVPEGTDEALGALDQKHEERLKEILGSHYDEINRRHQEYIESIQHLNREGLDGEIGISL